MRIIKMKFILCHRQENLKLLKLDSKNIEAILDTSHTKAELTQALSEKVLLAEKLEVNI